MLSPYAPSHIFLHIFLLHLNPCQKACCLVAWANWAAPSSPPFPPPRSRAQLASSGLSMPLHRLRHMPGTALGASLPPFYLGIPPYPSPPTPNLTPAAHRTPSTLSWPPPVSIALLYLPYLAALRYRLCPSLLSSTSCLCSAAASLPGGARTAVSQTYIPMS